MTMRRRASDYYITQQTGFALLVMVAKIACIDFSIEALIMQVIGLMGIHNLGPVVDFLDPLTLTLLSSPITYVWVVRPFAKAARDANAKVSQQLEESRLLLEQNERLTASLQQATEATADMHEKILQKIGGELHDGPAQLLTYILLQLDRLTPVAAMAKDQKIPADLEKFRRVINDTLSEVRAISTGLSLPELATTSIDDTITLAIRRHEELTGAKVQVSFDQMPSVISLNQKICTYRFIQEALANANRHAHAQTSHVKARGGSRMEITVQDDGQGFTPENAIGRGLGLTGMRARLQALGGQLDVQSAPGQGARVTASFSLETGQAA